MRDVSPRGASALALALGALIFASPLRAVWAREGAPWWVPFLLWAALLVLAAWVATRKERS
ncbi:MAG: hypothetical protein H6721_21425 [Sandaracinus sp.]|nr:hypothetical protein [Myxococcales bacterium]MCB9600982.1 hypothetical protein [Sandaracinus sp.]MCB9614106.1 hypothetical protein [Sandaracinus sp.]MCB9623795.1 hypothetical protein [Sandaracinus sp.]MCB9634696.1 hypothetical protein [Sandaracinus sp.]